MKDKQYMLKQLYATLVELESGALDEESKRDLKLMQCSKLETLYDILEDEVDEEYWSRIEEFI